MLMEPPALLQSDEEAIAGRFVRCGAGSAPNCVVDGDTIHVGRRRIRLIGIDAPETHPPRCAAEAVKGVAATDGLLAALQKGPVVMVARIDRPSDGYGRELRALYRVLPDGARVSIAEELVASGLVRPYLRGRRQSWCPAQS